MWHCSLTLVKGHHLHNRPYCKTDLTVELQNQIPKSKLQSQDSEVQCLVFEMCDQAYDGAMLHQLCTEIV